MADIGSLFNQDVADPVESRFAIEWNRLGFNSESILELQKWSDTAEKSKWKKLARKIDEALKNETVKTLSDVIPDNPLPARAIVKTIITLVQLGIVRSPLLSISSQTLSIRCRQQQIFRSKFASSLHRLSITSQTSSKQQTVTSKS